MIISASPPQVWTLELAAGSQLQAAFTFTTDAPGGTTPYPISGSTWEYIVRPTATSLSTTFSVTTTPSASGSITTTATDTLSQILLTVAPAATASLSGVYSHALWQDPATTEAFCWASGQIVIGATAQP